MLPALTSGHIAGIIVTLCAVTLVGIYAGRMVKSALDFSVGGRRAGATVVAGTIMGTLVGGSSTIGTAQLAFQYGLCAWWFTLGAGLACAVLGLGLARRLHESALETAPQYLVSVYGERIGPVASIFSSAGIYLNIIAQGLAAVALLTSMFRISPVTATLIGVCLVLAYVFFGGVWGTGLVGVAKLGLLYLATLASGALAYQMTGVGPALKSFPAYPWFSLFGGIQEDLAAGFHSGGVLSTQTYIQAICSAREPVKARTGALLSAFMIPPWASEAFLSACSCAQTFPTLLPNRSCPSSL